jgi:hypothetical protein
MSGLRFLLASWRWFRAGYVNEPEQRSHRLLRDWLSAEQRAQYDRHGHFEVVGCHSGRRYLIKHGWPSGKNSNYARKDRLNPKPRLLVMQRMRLGPAGKPLSPLAGPLPYCELLQRPLAEDAD